VTRSPDLFLLDTNVLVHLIRDSPIGRWVVQQYDLRNQSLKQLISVVTVGEALSFAKKRAWGLRRTEALADLLRELVVFPLDSEPVLDMYAEIDCHLQKIGRPIEQNDMWIAATAVATNAHLLTTDKDFDPLDPRFLTRTWIDPDLFKTSV
jgi:tRNA(fMet)-specific endonuclease VapC